MRSKIELLIDVGILDAEKKNNFLKFLEIRNQFMHNPEAITFAECFRNIDGIDNFLFKKFPCQHLTIDEEKYKYVYERLATSVLATASMIVNQLIKKRKNKEIDIPIKKW